MRTRQRDLGIEVEEIDTIEAAPPPDPLDEAWAGNAGSEESAPGEAAGFARPGLARTLWALLGWAWWCLIASRWLGGGPGHHTYCHARWMAWQYRATVRVFLLGRP